MHNVCEVENLQTQTPAQQLPPTKPDSQNRTHSDILNGLGWKGVDHSRLHTQISIIFFICVHIFLYDQEITVRYTCFSPALHDTTTVGERNELGAHGR